jgi:two-component system sensor histidine kinase PilS (NtrC family)
VAVDLRRRLLWLIGSRAAAVTVLLGSAIVIQIHSPGSLPVDPFFFLIGLTYTLTAVYSLLLRQAVQHRWIVDVQLALDVLIVSALVHMTGGVASSFSTLYMLPIIAASTIQSRRAGQELEEASNQIADLQAFSEYAINSLASGLLTTDLSGRVLTFNRAAETITGIPARYAIGRGTQEILQLPDQCSALFGPREKRPPLPRVEYDYTQSDGRQIELGISTAILITPRGESGFVITFQDVTEARKQERAARIQQRLAAVGEMAAGIAHEIRNPLASMSGSIQILRQELPLTGEQAQLMDIVMRESERLNETIKSFLAYARPQRQSAARLDLRKAVTDTTTLLQNSPELQQTHDLQLNVPDEPVWCTADEGQIRQIVWNLATNGLRAMPDGGLLTLTVSAVAAGGDATGEALIVVADEGVGIPSDQLEGILQPFRGGFSRGTGLGLSIVHRIVSDYGGELQVTSQPNHGTRVTVKLPLAGQLAAMAR